ncbi:MAG: hypothetical protein R3E12_02940 [Candidatus Eisenbacteria bacterium]
MSSSPSLHRILVATTGGLGASAALLTTGVGARDALADGRAFAFSYDTSTMAPGHLEYEQWVTWNDRYPDASSLRSFDLRHELEMGVHPRVQLALYLDWRYRTGGGIESDAEFEDVAAEVIYGMSNPVTDPLGSALYGEVRVGDEKVATEAKLLLDKKLARWDLVWNGIVESEWEEEGLAEREGELGQTLGASFQLRPAIAVGFELAHFIEIEEWRHAEDSVVHAGPNLSLRHRLGWMTFAPLFQLTDTEQPDVKLRWLVGIDL